MVMKMAKRDAEEDGQKDSDGMDVDEGAEEDGKDVTNFFEILKISSAIVGHFSKLLLL